MHSCSSQEGSGPLKGNKFQTSASAKARNTKRIKIIVKFDKPEETASEF